VVRRIRVAQQAGALRPPAHGHGGRTSPAQKVAACRRESTLLFSPQPSCRALPFAMSEIGGRVRFCSGSHPFGRFAALGVLLEGCNNWLSASPSGSGPLRKGKDRTP